MPTVTLGTNTSEWGTSSTTRMLYDIDHDGFSQTLFWSWGMRYMAGIDLVMSELKKVFFFLILVLEVILMHQRN